VELRRLQQLQRKRIGLGDGRRYDYGQHAGGVTTTTIDAFNGAIGGWDVGAVTSMVATFQHATVFSSDLGAWNTSSVASMRAMFYYLGMLLPSTRR